MIEQKRAIDLFSHRVFEDCDSFNLNWDLLRVEIAKSLMAYSTFSGKLPSLGDAVQTSWEAFTLCLAVDSLPSTSYTNR